MSEEVTEKSSKNKWLEEEDELVITNASVMTSSQISKLLKGRSAKSVRHRAESLGVRLTGYIKYSQKDILQAVELRAAGFSRSVIESETGLKPQSQIYYKAI